MDIMTPKEDAAQLMDIDSGDEVVGDYVISEDSAADDAGNVDEDYDSVTESATESEVSSEDADKKAAADFSKKHFTKEQVKEKVKEAMKDKSKFKEVMAKLKNADSDSVMKVKRYTDVNQEMRRNALTMANEMKVQKSLGDKLNLAQKKKVQQSQKQRRDMLKAAEIQKPGEIDCVFVVLNGGVSQTKADIEQIEKEGKWVLHPVILGEYKFAIIIDSSILSGRNRMASAILDETVCGPVRFMKVEEDVGVVPLNVKDFKAILKNHNVKFK